MDADGERIRTIARRSAPIIFVVVWCLAIFQRIMAVEGADPRVMPGRTKVAVDIDAINPRRVPARWKI